jgi:ABC-type glycerol-3-phosphate transport system substrate-binding protein
MIKRNYAVIIALVLFVALVFPMWGQVQQAPSGRNPLQGMNIVIGNWWADYDTATFKPRNDAEERTHAWRTKIQKDYGFTMREKNIASWAEMSSLAATSIMAGRPAATVFVLQSDWAMALKKQDLLFPVSDSRNNNLTNPRPVERGMQPPLWNQNSIKAFTFKDKTDRNKEKIYAFSNDINMTNAQVIFFNKRLFRDAGLDPNLLYDMQAKKWSWNDFLDICKKLTRDINNDGVMDTYAIPRDLSTDILDAIVSSNGAMYVDRDPRTGKFVNATSRPEFVEALQFAVRLYHEGIMKPKPADANWDWYKAEFADGNVAMRIDESYVWGELQNMKDDWGVVLFPGGPKSPGRPRVFTRENIIIIPSTYKPADVEKILYALMLWYTPQSADWKSGWYNTFRDRRAVDETLTMIHDASLHIPKNHIFIPGLNRGAIAWEMWFHEGDPAQLIEQVSQDWNNKIEDVNEELGY